MQNALHITKEATTQTVGHSTTKVAIVIANTGTPRSAAWYDVARFLFHFLNDKHVVNLPLIARILLVNGVIIPSHLRTSVKRYTDFFNSKHPTLTQQSQALEQKLNKQLPAGFKAFAAMRYSKPTLKEALRTIHGEGFNKIILIPLFPQYAESTTGSVIDKFSNIISRWKVSPDVRIVENFHNHPLYIQALVDTINNFKTNNYDHILFSYHSLPLSHIASKSGTPRCYKTACEHTTHLAAQRLKLSEAMYSTCYQSRMSPHTWLGPFTNDMLIQLAHQGKKRVLLISPGLVADCLETIHELAHESAELFCKSGGEKLDVVPCLNSSQAWVNALATLAESEKVE